MATTRILLDTAALVSLFFAYAILPMLIGTLQPGADAFLWPGFFTKFHEFHALYALSGLLQAAPMLWLLCRRVRERSMRNET